MRKIRWEIRWDVIAYILGAVLFAFGFRFLTFHNLPHFSAKVEAQIRMPVDQSPQVLHLQREITFPDHTVIRVVCDHANGKQYIVFNSSGSTRGGVDLEIVPEAVPNDCLKNPR